MADQTIISESSVRQGRREGALECCARPPLWGISSLWRTASAICTCNGSAEACVACVPVWDSRLTKHHSYPLSSTQNVRCSHKKSTVDKPCVLWLHWFIDLGLLCVGKCSRHVEGAAHRLALGGIHVCSSPQWPSVEHTTAVKTTVVPLVSGLVTSVRCMAPHRSFRDTLVVLFSTTFWEEGALILTSLVDLLEREINQ